MNRTIKQQVIFDNSAELTSFRTYSITISFDDYVMVDCIVLNIR